MNKNCMITVRTLILAGILLLLNMPTIADAQSGKGGTQFVPPQPTSITQPGSSPQATCTPISASQTIMTEGFEGIWPPSSGGWTVTGNPTWDDDDYKPHLGSWSAWAANGGTLGVDPASNNYLNNIELLFNNYHDREDSSAPNNTKPRDPA